MERAKGIDQLRGAEVRETQRDRERPFASADNHSPPSHFLLVYRLSEDP